MNKTSILLKFLFALVVLGIGYIILFRGPVVEQDIEVETPYEIENNEQILFIGHGFSPEWIFKQQEKNWEVITAADVWSTSDMKHWEFIRPLNFVFERNNFSFMSRTYPGDFENFLELFTPKSQIQSGIGILFMRKNEQWVVSDILPGTSAFSSDIVVGDVLISIEGNSVYDLKYYSDILSLLKGEEGVLVNLQLKEIDETVKNVSLEIEVIPEQYIYTTPVVSKYNKLPLGSIAGKIVTLVKDKSSVLTEETQKDKFNIWTSYNGKQWNKETSQLVMPKDSYVFPQSFGINGTLYFVTRYATDDEFGTMEFVLWSSKDGSSWNPLQPADLVLPNESGNDDYFFFTFNNKFFLKVNYANGCCYTGSDFFSSEDGVSWSRFDVQPGFETDYISDSIIEFKNKLFLVTALAQGCGEEECTFFEGNTVWTSEDGINWVRQTSNLPEDANFYDILIKLNNKLYLIEFSNSGNPEDFSHVIWSSEDGINWIREGNAPLWQTEDTNFIVL